MLAPPPAHIVDALIEFAAASDLLMPQQVKLGGATAIRLEKDEQRFFFGGLAEGAEFGDIVAAFKSQLPAAFDEPGVHEVVVGVAGLLATDAVPATVARGVRVLPLQEALAALVGLPRTWRDQQLDLLATVLQPLTTDAGLQVVTLRSDDGKAVDTALDEAPIGKLVYLRADAGKGKSTVLAWRTQRRMQDHRGDVPSVFVPLRELKRSEGVSWGAVAARLGVLGEDAQVLATAVKVGLVHVSLDGLDEVAGRYDPNVVADVLAVLRDVLLGPRARVHLSGRTTESGLLDPAWSVQVGLQLPGPTEDDFALFVDAVSRRVAPNWAEVFSQVPEPMLGVEDSSELSDRALSDTDVESRNSGG